MRLSAERRSGFTSAYGDDSERREDEHAVAVAHLVVAVVSRPEQELHVLGEGAGGVAVGRDRDDGSSAGAHEPGDDDRVSAAAHARDVDAGARLGAGGDLGQAGDDHPLRRQHRRKRRREIEFLHGPLLVRTVDEPQAAPRCRARAWVVDCGPWEECDRSLGAA